jgi:hypothetical protein
MTNRKRQIRTLRPFLETYESKLLLSTATAPPALVGPVSTPLTPKLTPPPSPVATPGPVTLPIIAPIAEAAGQRRSVTNERVFPGGPTYGQTVETYFATVFPSGGTYNGVTVSRDKIVAERVETDDNGGWWITVRGSYSVSILGKKIAAERVYVSYDNGNVTVSTGGFKGIFSTSGIANWVRGTLNNYPGANHYDVFVSNKTSSKLTVYVNFQQKSGAWTTNRYTLNPGQTARLNQLKTTNRWIYFRAEDGKGKVWTGSQTKNIDIGGRVVAMGEVNMGAKFVQYTYSFLP